MSEGGVRPYPSALPGHGAAVAAIPTGEHLPLWWKMNSFGTEGKYVVVTQMLRTQRTFAWSVMLPK